MENNNKMGVLLVNLGTPDSPTASSVRRYLSEFLHDKRVVDLSRWLWCPILHGVILRLRPSKVAKLYQTIWTKDGSPLLVYTRRQAEQLEQKLAASNIKVAFAMNYGNPSLKKGLERLSDCRNVLVLPLYPQYSSSTTASVFDRIAKAVANNRSIPEFSFIRSYFQEPEYITALAKSVRFFWKDNQPTDVLLMSFHGIPQRYENEGDSYPEECRITAQLLAKELGLKDHQWKIAFQSRFGREEWVKPYTDEILKELAQKGRSVTVICPGFSSDCLETLEEIDEQNRELFLNAGGKEFHYVPCLNDQEMHIDLLEHLIKKKLAPANAI